jgi:F-type H+-transporting ATPase subunit epsilon
MAELGRTRFQLEVDTPQRLIVRDEDTELSAPGSEGYFGVLPGHIPFITTLRIGELTYWRGKDERHLAVTWGYVEVLGEKVIILAETAERAEEIDAERARNARARAEGRLKEWVEGSEAIDEARAEAALRRALTRLVAGRAAETAFSNHDLQITQIPFESSHAEIPLRTPRIRRRDNPPRPLS